MKTIYNQMYLLIVSIALAIWVSLILNPLPPAFALKPTLCGREHSQRSSGFTERIDGTYIKAIQVDIHSNKNSIVTLNWVNEELDKKPLPTRFYASPGAGNCNVDCRSIKASQKEGSHCTPLSPPTYLIQGYGCMLSRYPGAKFVSWLDVNRGIAFHSYPVPAYPASHGCIRLATKNHGAEWIYDNSLAGITEVQIRWDPTEKTSPKCWRGNNLVTRKTK